MTLFFRGVEGQEWAADVTCQCRGGSSKIVSTKGLRMGKQLEAREIKMSELQSGWSGNERRVGGPGLLEAQPSSPGWRA